MQPNTPHVTGILGTAHDDAYTASKHTRSGKQALKDLAKGKSAHVFDEGVDIGALEEGLDGRHLSRSSAQWPPSDV